jgi:hypothetical protein
MKDKLLSFAKTMVQDRFIAILLVVFLLVCLLLLGYLAVTLKPSELQVVVHYTSFGTTNFYRDRWYYLLSFGLFAVITATIHIILTYKLLQSRGRDITIAFIWMSIILVIIAVALFYQVLKIASLS